MQIDIFQHIYPHLYSEHKLSVVQNNKINTFSINYRRCICLAFYFTTYRLPNRATLYTVVLGAINVALRIIIFINLGQVEENCDESSLREMK